MTKTDEAASAARTPAAHVRFRLPEEIGVIIALVVMMAVIGVARPRFLNPINLFTLLGNTTFLGMLAVGMVFLLAIREIDLSVGWMFNFSAVLAALLMVAGIDPWLAAMAGVVFGAGCSGCVNGVIAVTPAAAGHHRHARHLFDVPGPVAGREQWPGDRAAGPERAASSSVISTKTFGVLPVAAAGVRRAGRGHACRPAPHPLRLSCAGGRQQPGGRRPCRHLQRRRCGCRRWC